MFKLDLGEVKGWLRVDEDHDEDDVLITGLMRSAERFVIGGTGRKDFGEDTELAKTVCQCLISHWYENRGMHIQRPQSAENPIINIMIAQLGFGGDSNGG